jgi:ribosomal protein S27AE
MASYGASRSRNRLTAGQAGYMELAGAVKDADCLKVFVPDGISSELGCCNEFQPEAKDTERFRCGECEYLTEKEK